MKRLLWQDSDNSNKYNLVKSEEVCQPVDQGGLGVVNLVLRNRCLLSKWLWKIENEEDMWQDLIRKKNIVIKRMSCALIENLPSLIL